MNDKEIKNQIESLKSSPLFNASLASKELFHSNFLAWIFENRKRETINFFESLNLGLELSQNFKVEREKRNVDITLLFDKSIILIENKVKSIPYESQLERYSKRLDEGNGKLILLSLFKFQSTSCISLSYNKIADWLETINRKPESNESTDEKPIKEYYIIQDYIFFIRNLVKLFTAISNNTNGNNNSLFDFYSHSQLYQDFQEVRLHDILHKIKYRDIRIEIENKIQQTFENSIEGLFSASDYFSRATAAANFKIVINPDDKKRRYFEIQFQDDYLRFMLFSANCVPFYENIIQNENFRWFFEFSELHNNREIFLKPNARKDFNKYGNYIIYNYVRIKLNVEMDALVSNIYNVVLKTLNNLKSDNIRLQMNNFLDNMK